MHIAKHTGAGRVNMELGNMAFGHSRGAVPLDDRQGFGEAFEALLDAMGCGLCYGKHHENEVFYMHPYCWCDYESCPQCGTGEQFNFFHKASRLGIRWYKYPFRDSYLTRAVSVAEFRAIVAECVASVKEQPE